MSRWIEVQRFASHALLMLNKGLLHKQKNHPT
jgi:hypothetical protein